MSEQETATSASLEVTVNYATCKKFLISKGLRASNEGVIAFQKAMNKFANELAARATEKATAKGKKTVME